MYICIYVYMYMLHIGPHHRARLQPGQRQAPLPVDHRRGQAAGESQYRRL